VLALLLLAPTIPELLTGSTPISTVVYDPPLFAIQFLGIVGLYGTGALLIREFVVYFRKGWASVLLLGAAYGIAEEGLAVHTFFAAGPPVGALATYGHLFGVNWLWALGLTIFHATYSIALPILLVGLWFPEARGRRWLDRGMVGVVAFVYLFVVGLFSITVGHGPTPELLAVFLGVVVVLLGLAYGAPRDLLAVRPGPRRVGKWGLGLSGTLSFDVWLAVLILSGRPIVPAVVSAAIVVAVNLVALTVVLRGVGTEDLERSEFYFAVGLLAILFVFDVIEEFSVPGILAVSAIIAYLLFRIGRALDRRAYESSVRAMGPPAQGS
jgi:hypothetical protein